MFSSFQKSGKEILAPNLFINEITFLKIKNK